MVVLLDVVIVLGDVEASLDSKPFVVRSVGNVEEEVVVDADVFVGKEAVVEGEVDKEGSLSVNTVSSREMVEGLDEDPVVVVDVELATVEVDVDASSLLA